MEGQRMDIVKIFLIFILGSMVIIECRQGSKSKWQPVQGPLLTKWAKDVSPDHVLYEYPRPQMVRKEWQSLNGMWEYAILPLDQVQPQAFNGHILVPFPVESALSGVGRFVGEENRLWYKRSFDLPGDWVNRRILLHFGAVDWETTLWINGRELGTHRGGYDSFTFDITNALHESGAQEIVLSVWDPVNAGTQPRGKQVKRPRGIWYTSVTGIWQSVWIEPVNRSYISSLKIVPDIDAGVVHVNAVCVEADTDFSIEADLKEDGNINGNFKVKAGDLITIPIKNPSLWSPDSPFLYNIQITLNDRKGKKVDQVLSYFGMRKLSLGKDEQGITRLMLNNEFVFQFGPLDQGWWPDGLYTAPSDEALKYDIEMTKKLGYNMARKHVKIEPDRWYYWCDRLGLLVWQDMPSGDRYIDPMEPDFKRSSESAKQFELELSRLIELRINHPCIVIWVPFNEGWGQYDTARIVDLIQKKDPTRLVINTSGWADRGVGDVHDIHAYPGPATPEVEESRAIVLGEFGGLGLPVQGHTWQEEDNWGYREYNDALELTDAYRNLITLLQPMIKNGLSAAVYTQTTDVEVEVNGLMTYDRAIVKMDPKEVNRINRGYLPPIIKSKHRIFLNSASIKIENISQPGNIRYTLDGSDPDIESSIYTNPVTINKTTTIKARMFWPDGTKSIVTEFTCKKVSLREPLKVSGVKPGLRYACFEDVNEEWSRLPDFSLLEPTVSGIVSKCNLKPALSDEYFGLVFKGYIWVQDDGIYTFYTNSDDGTKLFIDNEEVVTNDFNHPMTEKSGEIALKAGMYPFKVTFFQGRGGKGLEVSYHGPGVKKQEIELQAFFHREGM